MNDGEKDFADIEAVTVLIICWNCHNEIENEDGRFEWKASKVQGRELKCPVCGKINIVGV